MNVSTYLFSHSTFLKTRRQNKFKEDFEPLGRIMLFDALHYCSVLCAFLVNIVCRLMLSSLLLLKAKRKTASRDGKQVSYSFPNYRFSLRLRTQNPNINFGYARVTLERKKDSTEEELESIRFPPFISYGKKSLKKENEREL